MSKNKKNKSRSFIDRLPKKYILLSFIIIGVIAYSSVLNGEFIFDDEILILRNESIRSLGNIPKFFSDSITSGAFIDSGNFYRPIQMIAYSVLYSLFRTDSFIFHLLPVVLHSFNAFFVFLLIKRLKISSLAALVAALLFLLHPVQTQAVAYISGLADPLGLFFLLSSLLILSGEKSLSPIKKNLQYALGLFLILLAFLTKESFVVGGLLLAIYTFKDWKDKTHPEFQIRWLTILFSVILGGAYLLARATILNFTKGFGLATVETTYTQNIWLRVSTFISVIWDYFILLVFPKNLYYEKPLTIFSTIFSLRGLFGLATIVSLLTGTILGFTKKNYPIFVACSWIIISMIPFSGIIPLNAYYLEHWLYLPFVGISILVAILLDKPIRNKSIQVVCLIILILIAARTYVRAGEWGSALTFFNNEIQYNQNSARIFNNLAMIQSEKGDYNSAIANFKKAIELRDDYAETRHNLGNAYALNKEYEKAFYEFYRSLQINPNFIYSHAKMQRLFEITPGQQQKAQLFKSFVNRIREGGTVTFDEIEKGLGSNINNQDSESSE